MILELSYIFVYRGSNGGRIVLRCSFVSKIICIDLYMVVVKNGLIGLL